MFHCNTGITFADNGPLYTYVHTPDIINIYVIFLINLML